MISRVIFYAVLPTWSRYVFYPILLGALFIHYAQTREFDGFNGFDISNALVPKEEILHGGPAKDGIPALTDPSFIRATQASYLKPSDRVLTIQRQGVYKAYPIKILNHHELVNDLVGNQAVLISYCPLCGSGVAFDALKSGKRQLFGVSGLLYNSDVLMYDEQTESLWSQIEMLAISGPLRGEKLNSLILGHTSWRDWISRHPDSWVLSDKTGFKRDYSRNPYAGYEKDNNLYFPVIFQNRRYHPKEIVMGISIDGKYKAYPFVELASGSPPIYDNFVKQALQIKYDSQHRTGKVLDQSGKEIPSHIMYWFAWYAFHPETKIFQVANDGNERAQNH